MKLVNILTLSKISITINQFFGTNRLYPFFNAVMIKLGVYRILVNVFLKFGGTPIVTANMRDNTKLLIDLRSNTEYLAFFSGEYDSDLIEILDNLLEPDDYFLDIGANIGFYSISIGAKIRAKGQGKVIAFEPFEGNFNRLKDNLNLNNLEDYCLLNKIGLSNENLDSLITLREDFKSGSNTGNASISINKKIDSRFEKVSIKLEKLDDFWKKFDGEPRKISLIKMDIEGHEDFCLEGGSEIIKEHRPTILMEINKPYYKARGVVSLDELFLPLFPERYSIYWFDNNKWIQIFTINKCKEIDNVFLIPNEKIQHNNYKIFN